MKSEKWGHRPVMGCLSALGMILAVACGDAGTGDGTDPDNPIDPPGGKGTSWNPSGTTGECNVDALLPVHAYATKVKGLLTGLPLTDEELSSLQDESVELDDLIDGWLQTPQAEGVLMRFFMTAFQQTGGDVESFFYLQGRNAASTGNFIQPNSARAHEMLNQNFAESFARTAVELVKEGRPWNEVVTTDEYMMTTAQMVFLAYKDDVVVHDDESKTVRHTRNDYPQIRLVTAEGQAPPANQVFNPNSNNYMTFYHHRLQDGTGGCAVNGTVTANENPAIGQWRSANNSDFGRANFIYMAMMGRHESVRKHNVTPNCNTGAANRRPLLQREDFSDWHKVKIVKAGQGNPATAFWDLNNIRGASQLNLVQDHRGFLTSPGFLSTWPNNEDNSSRVTINQYLIVALGQSFDGEAVSNFEPQGLDVEHAGPGTECYGCHQTLDPMRDLVRASLTNHYGEQLDENRQGMEGTFIFGGEEATGNGIVDLSNMLANHPSFATGWIEKLCYFANSEACPKGEELDRIVQAFVDSNLDLRVAIRELFSSPLVTGKECVADVDAGTTATISRRSSFCANLSNRLGIRDVCSILTSRQDGSNLQDQMSDATASIPDDTFSRAVVEPVTIAETGLFVRANREAACVVAAQNAYDQVYAEMAPADVIDSLVIDLMGLPFSDPRHDQAITILTNHMTEAIDVEGKPEDEALQSAFVLACMSPGVSGVGF